MVAISVHPSFDVSPADVCVGLIGAGIQASLTPAMHMREGRAQGLAYDYRLIDLDVLQVDANALPDLIAAAEKAGFAGLNITFPLKQSVLRELSDLSDDARALGAVNTVVLDAGRRVGHNTNCWGFAEAFRRNFNDVARDIVVLLGAGGAGAAVAHALLECGVGTLRIVEADTAKGLMSITQCLGRRHGAGRGVPGSLVMPTGVALTRQPASTLSLPFSKAVCAISRLDIAARPGGMAGVPRAHKGMLELY